MMQAANPEGRSVLQIWSRDSCSPYGFEMPVRGQLVHASLSCGAISARPVTCQNCTIMAWLVPVKAVLDGLPKEAY